MTRISNPIQDQALDWLVKVNDPDFSDWEALDAWLDAEPAHSAAYLELASKDAEIAEAYTEQAQADVPKVATVRALPPSGTRRMTPGWTAWGSIAAAVVLGIGVVWFSAANRPQPWTIETAAGERQTVELADGSVITLDGATKVSLDKRRPRSVVLEHGRALFTVTHDEDRPFSVLVGETKIVDLGTVFDVNRSMKGTRIAVAEGSVRVNHLQMVATLDPGDAVKVTDDRLVEDRVETSSVSGWTKGRLKYRNESIGVVAEDIERALGTRVLVAPTLVERTFSGGLSIGGDRRDLKRRLALLLDVTVQETPDGTTWRLEPKG